MTTDTIITTDLTPAEAAHLLTALEKGKQAAWLATRRNPNRILVRVSGWIERRQRSLSDRVHAPQTNGPASAAGRSPRARGGSASALATTATPLQATGRVRSRS